MSVKLHNKYIHNPEWTCPKKQESRDITIVSAYRSIFNRQNIPSNSQYWTLCGGYYNKEKQPLWKGTELDQLTQSGLITIGQYHGVDRENYIIEQNRIHFPQVHWHYGEFLQVARDQAADEKFKPAIVNLDGLNQPRLSIENLKRILRLIDYNCPQEVLLLVNVVLDCPYKGDSPDQLFDGNDFMREFFNNQQVRIAKHWIIGSDYFEYPGSGEGSKTIMGTFIFAKEKNKHVEYGDEVRWMTFAT